MKRTAKCSISTPKLSRDKDGSGVVTTERAPDGFKADPTPLAAQGTEQRGAEVKEAQNGRHQDSGQLGKEQNVLETSKQPIGVLIVHRGSLRPVKSRGAKPHGGTVSREKGQSPLEPRPAPPELCVKDCRQTAARLSAGPSAAKPDGVAVTPKHPITTTRK